MVFDKRILKYNLEIELVKSIEQFSKIYLHEIYFNIFLKVI